VGLDSVQSLADEPPSSATRDLPASIVAAVHQAPESPRSAIRWR